MKKLQTIATATLLGLSLQLSAQILPKIQLQDTTSLDNDEYEVTTRYDYNTEDLTMEFISYKLYSKDGHLKERTIVENQERVKEHTIIKRNDTYGIDSIFETKFYYPRNLMQQRDSMYIRHQFDTELKNELSATAKTIHSMFKEMTHYFYAKGNDGDPIKNDLFTGKYSIYKIEQIHNNYTVALLENKESKQVELITYCISNKDENLILFDHIADGFIGSQTDPDKDNKLEWLNKYEYLNSFEELSLKPLNIDELIQNNN